MHYLDLYPRLSRYRNLENTRRKAHLVKWRSMENLDRLLHEFESHALRRGLQVVWANDEADAREELSKIFRDHGVQSAGFSHDVLTKELDMQGFLADAKIRVVEDSNSADAQILSADFLIAETGSIVLPGMQKQSPPSSKSPIQVVLSGIERVVPHLVDIHLFQPLRQAHSKEGEYPDSFTIINGNPQHQTSYLILLDNGRTDLLAATEQRQGLYCIGCEACLHVCPVYQTSGDTGHGKSYTGPIGSLITPHTEGMKAFKHLSERSSLCGQCNEVCPVNINISKMLLLNRRDAVVAGYTSTAEKITWKSYARVMKKRKWLDLLGARTKNVLLRLFLKKKWGNQRSLPRIDKKSYAAMSQEGTKNTTIDANT